MEQSTVSNQAFCPVLKWNALYICRDLKKKLENGKGSIAATGVMHPLVSNGSRDLGEN